MKSTSSSTVSIFTDPGFNQNGNNYFFNGISSTQIVPGAG